MNLLAVYGTLKRGNSNEDFLSTSEFIGKGRTIERHPMYDNSFGSFPYLCEVPGEGHCIVVEVYNVSDEVLDCIDILEGISSGFYYRGYIDVEINGYKHECIIYFSSDKYGYEGKPLLTEWEEGYDEFKSYCTEL